MIAASAASRRPAPSRRRRFYKLFVRGACITTSASAAEMVKLTENAFRDVNIAFANELSLICDRFKINVWEVIELANRHPRVNILRPGPGVGGHCIAIDPWFIVDSAPDLARIIRAGREVNDSKIEATFQRACSLIDEHPFAAIACLGLAFKANVDDLRESPALEVALQACATLRRPRKSRRTVYRGTPGGAGQGRRRSRRTRRGYSRLRSRDRPG